MHQFHLLQKVEAIKKMELISLLTMPMIVEVKG